MEHAQDNQLDHSLPKIAALDLAELYRCVHCGLCLNQCPTYRVLRLEPESPRGRIHLVKAAADGRIELNERFKEHLYLCLLCRACETACPSGVQYGHIAEKAREMIGPPGSKIARAVLKFVFTRLLPYPRRLRTAAGFLRLYQRTGLQRFMRLLLPAKLREMDSMLPVIPSRFFEPNVGALPAIGARRARVAMLNGCVMPFLFGDVNEATVRVLRRNGCEVVFPKDQICCGALNTHNGESVAAKMMARQNIDAFLEAGVDAVVVNAAGCGAAMKEYGHLLRDDAAYADKATRFSALVRDAGEFLAGLGLVGKLARLEMTVTYQDPCHLAHGQRVRAQPRKLLESIPGLKLVEMEASDRCCGSAGIYNITHSGMSQHLLKEKMESVSATQAEAIVAPNPGCMLQLRYGAQRYGPAVSVYHLMDLLDRAYAEAEAPK
ncbi:MAG: heterodisulfide reductase-related iron-sulfur binding cluster [Deltaproteobacteria bacterium]|nr:heterodisulfide reductase-related iron-sulfur binding cluster [Deltaproteobacteria bacterium]MDZ4341242.1 heterodisulfide reductase-related iron-sulfur binding cluster [Candidatus Binatia bacterium]